MYLTDRLHAWSELDPAIAFGETQYIGTKRLKLSINITYNARQGEHADWLIRGAFQDFGVGLGKAA